MVLPTVVELGGLLPRVFARTLEVAKPSLRILMLHRSAASGTCLLSQICLDGWPYLGLVAGWYRMSMFFLVMRHILLL